MGCQMVILNVPRSRTQNYQLSFPVEGYSLELLSAKEAKVLQDALFTEYCVEHSMFHCIGDPQETCRWLYELRKA